MKTRAEVHPAKLRGGYYSPDELVRTCYERVEALIPDTTGLNLLEPAAGDGAFFRGLPAASGLSGRLGKCVAVELAEREALLCRASLDTLSCQSELHIGSAIRWAVTSSEWFDVAVGNPPFVRFQFLSKEDKACMDLLGQRLGLTFAGVSNIWIPIFLGALDHLRDGGVFAFIIPTECLTGVSAGVARDWLGRNVDCLQIDIFPPGSFPAVLQEVLVISGRRRERVADTTDHRLRFVEHRRYSATTSWEHTIPVGHGAWTRYLLTPMHLEVLSGAQALPNIYSLRTLAKFEVAAVTGANEFFSIDAKAAQAFHLQDSLTPMLPRIRHARGLRYTGADHDAATRSGAKTQLLTIHTECPADAAHAGLRRYLKEGERLGLHRRYKCRIRDPWYSVPYVKVGTLMLSKRSHHFPRLVLNDIGVVTTDTIYRGWLRKEATGGEAAFVAGFHNSLTLLTSEVEGRSFGGGVLELVPSEIGRLLVPMAENMSGHLDELDSLLRAESENEDVSQLVTETNRRLARGGIGLTPNDWRVLEDGRVQMMQRRLDRNAESNTIAA